VKNCGRQGRVSVSHLALTHDRPSSRDIKRTRPLRQYCESRSLRFGRNSSCCPVSAKYRSRLARLHGTRLECMHVSSELERLPPDKGADQ
jgi:hypothetical protein